VVRLDTEVKNKTSLTILSEQNESKDLTSYTGQLTAAFFTMSYWPK